MEYSGYDLGLLVFTVVMGAMFTMFGFIKGAEDEWPSFLVAPGEVGCLLFAKISSFNIFTHPFSSSFDSSEAMDFQFSSMEERIISSKKRERKIGFYLRKEGKCILAVVGRQNVASHNMSFEVCKSFVRIYASHLCVGQPLKWDTKREMLDWLSTLILQPNVQPVKEEVCCTNKGNTFFKVLIGEFYDYLNIPASYDNIKNGSMSLRNGEREWTVQVDGRVINKGWNDFVKAHKLCEGDFLLFTAQGEMCFNVAIFGSNGRIKEFPWFHVFNPDGRIVYF